MNPVLFLFLFLNLISCDKTPRCLSKLTKKTPRSVMSLLSLIGTAFTSVKNFLNITNEIFMVSEQATKAVNSFQPITPLVESFVPYISSLGSTVRAISGVIIQIEWFLGAARPERYLAANKSLFQTQIEAFKARVNKQFEQIFNLTVQQKQQLENISEQQVEVFFDMSQQFQQSRNATEEETKELDAILQLVKTGFSLLQRQMKLKSAEINLSEYLETPSGINYARYVQKPLFEIKKAFVHFVNNMVNISETKSITGPLNNLIRKCCKHSPFVIMNNIFYSTTIRKARDTNYFFAIYHNYFAKNSKRMMNFFSVMVSDLFTVLQLLQMCDELTDIQEFGFKYTVNNSVEIAKALDDVTRKIIPESYELLVDDSPIIKTILEEYKLEKNTFDASILGCYYNESVGDKNHDFADFAAYSLEKRFHFLRFFVTIGYYTDIESHTPKEKILQCSKSTFQYFIYTTRQFPDIQEYEEDPRKFAKLFILSSYIAQNVPFDYDCVFDVKAPCYETFFPTPPEDKYQIICVMPPNVSYCAYSSAYYPLAVEQCENSVLVTACG